MAADVEVTHALLELGAATLGQAFVILVGGLDLAVASVMDGRELLYQLIKTYADQK